MAQNPAFISDADYCDKTVSYCVTPGDLPFTAPSNITIVETPASPETSSKDETVKTISLQPLPSPSKDRDQWGNDIEFLFSCIALSVGLGNVWRFPFTALQNGGGAFLIPYLIVLFLIGKPVYYMEMLLGQFSSRGSIKVFDMCPAMRGLGYSQTMATGIVTTFYSSIMALTIRYFLASFQDPLPWTKCEDDWSNENMTCVSAAEKTGIYGGASGNHTGRSSAELYFLKLILKESANIDDGIGVPNWQLALCLIFAWICVTTILIKGVRSSGKASYFLAVFPYIIMFILLARACTLPGAWKGIMFFIEPQWDKIFDAKVWYAAVTQVFFSLAICFGNIIMYASYNRFSHNIYRDVNIVTALDTFTSLLSGFIIFGILGHLAFVTGAENIKDVVKPGPGLAFISYPDAIAKFEYLPQLFSVLFFLMLFVLGIGSNIGMAGCVMTVIRDKFPDIKPWKVAVSIGIIGCSVGFVYTTPGGQYVLTLVDFFGASFVAFVLAIVELITISWIYGVNRLCKDTEFMLGIKTGLYWRICWGIVTPALMGSIMIYTLVTLKPLTYNNYVYPNSAYAFGWCLTTFLILQLPLWMFYAFVKAKGETVIEKFVASFKPTEDWGPTDPVTNEKYQKFLKESYYSQECLFKTRGMVKGLLEYARRNLFD
ncbi:sodium-dependent nutrient amino acid transporter 1-like [Culicoides brevitarsis]|uniref:sodium-dependent nutrient amino acid transporter 1-like n=1 Tax=Culicoides brevitarsis TaxID=469753 RepID=UPI00307B2454